MSLLFAIYIGVIWLFGVLIGGIISDVLFPIYGNIVQLIFSIIFTIVFAPIMKRLLLYNHRKLLLVIAFVVVELYLIVLLLWAVRYDLPVTISVVVLRNFLFKYMFLIFGIIALPAAILRLMLDGKYKHDYRQDNPPDLPNNTGIE